MRCMKTYAMNMNVGATVNHNEYVDTIISLFKAIRELLFAGAGGCVAYMYDYTTLSKSNSEHKWSWKTFFINMFISSFVGYTIGSFIPIDYAYRDGIIGFSGVSAYTIIGLVESKFASFVVDKLTGGGFRNEDKKG